MLSHRLSESDWPTVLVVEEDPDIRGLLSRCLRRRLFDVIEAKDGVQALELSRSFKGEIRLLLTDVDVPGIDGVTLSRKLTAERKGIRVVLMSGGCPEEALQQGPRRTFLQKPFTIQTLFSAIDEVMRDRQLESAVNQLRARDGISRVEVLHDGMYGRTCIRIAVSEPVPGEFSLTAFEAKMMAFYPVSNEELITGEFPPESLAIEAVTRPDAVFIAVHA